MSKQVGETTWSVPSSGNRRGDDRKPFPFFKMEDYGKSYKMRVVSDKPAMYHCHWTTGPDGGNIKVNCTLTKDCPVLNADKVRCAGTAAQSRYYVKVIDRADGEIKVLDIGTQIFKQIVDLHNDEEWGHSKNYDISVKKGNKGDNPLYSVIPGVKKPLTDAEQAKVDASNDSEGENFIDVKSRCQALTAETITRILTGESSEPKARAGRTADQAAPAPKAQKTPEPAVATPTGTTEEDDQIDWDDSNP